jgi:hypothetical protein
VSFSGMWNNHKNWEMFLVTLIEQFAFVEGKAQVKVC